MPDELFIKQLYRQFSTQEINRLLEEARKRPPMTATEIRAQRISFVYGQLMDCAPHITKEKIALLHDAQYGNIK